MNAILILVTLTIGLVAGGASHAQHRAGNLKTDLVGSSTNQRELIDVPYTVEYNNPGQGYQHSGGNSYPYGRTYQPQPQPQYQIQRSEPTYQNSYSYPQPRYQTQSEQYVDIPYSVEYNKDQGHSRGYPQQPQVQQRTYPQPQQPQQSQQYEIPFTPQLQRRAYPAPSQQQYSQQQSQQLVDVPYTVEQVQHAPIQNQRTFPSHPQPRPQTVQQQLAPRQPKQLVDIPYMIEQVQHAPIQNQRSLSPQPQPQPRPHPVQQQQPVTRQPKQLVDVSYTVEEVQQTPVQTQRSYSPQPQPRTQPVQQPVARQPKQLVDLPYTEQASQSQNLGNGFRFLPFSTGNSLSGQIPQQAISRPQLDYSYQVLGHGVGAPSSSNDFRFIPYSFGNTLPINTFGGRLSGGYVHPLNNVGVGTSVLPII